MTASYYAQVKALVEAGVDILLPETAIDTLNLKACLFAIQQFFDATGQRVPVMVSATFDSGRRHICVGANCRSFLARDRALSFALSGNELCAGSRRYATAH